MNKQELIKHIRALPYSKGPLKDTAEVNIGWLIRNIDQLDEPETAKVPQFVADFIAEQKKLGHTLSYSIDASMSDRVAEWYWDNSELFALAWLDGYEVDEEKRYMVKITKTDQYLHSRDNDFFFVTYVRPDDNPHNCHTRKQLEDADFGWVFDCPGIEMEEVE